MSKVLKHDIEGLWILHPEVFSDDRGQLFETFRSLELRSVGLDVSFVQENHSVSKKGVIRGLHYQENPFAQGKLVRVVSGAIWDVAVDLRSDSRTKGKWSSIELTADNRTQIYIPAGFAHGFLALTETAEVVYKCTAEYHQASEAGFRWDDPDFAIQWPRLDVEYLISPRDQTLPFWNDH